MSSPTRPKPGDIFSIPLPDGRKAYGQYLLRGELGQLIRVFDLITSEIVPVDQLITAGELFPPVYVFLLPPLRIGHWQVIGRLPLGEILHPKFRYTHGYTPGTYGDWRIWDGENMLFVGRLPPEFGALEIHCTWGYELLEQRIAFGTNPFAGLQ